MRTSRRVLGFAATAALLSPALVAATATATQDAKPSGVLVTNPIPYMDDDPYVGHPCSEDTSILHYKVFYPSRLPGVTYPIVFVFQGAGFHSVSDCDPDTGQDIWLSMDNEAATWAANGFVAVNVEYHGLDATPPLYGDSTCPTPDCQRAEWGSAADGYVERNLKHAVEKFFQRNPFERYGADESKGLIAFGGSAGSESVVLPASAQGFYDQCVARGVSRCWLRLLNTGEHATGYENYIFRGPSDPVEVTVPAAPAGATVFQESICFAHRVLGIPDTNCP